jgi:hypothetical protein
VLDLILKAIGRTIDLLNIRELRGRMRPAEFSYQTI